MMRAALLAKGATRLAPGRLHADSRVARVALYGTSSAPDLFTALKEITPKEQAKFKSLKERHGDKVLCDVKVEQALGGARDVSCIVWETSLLDAQEGIRFRGMSIPELQKALPPASGVKGKEPGPEALLWLLLTNTVPTAAQAASVTKELHKRSKLPAHVEPLIRSFPKDLHPMTQFSMAVLAMQSDSVFAKAYASGAPKAKYAEFMWDPLESTCRHASLSIL